MIKKVRFMGLVPVLFCVAMSSLACGVVWWSSARADSAYSKNVTPPQWAIVRVDLPANDAPFPPGAGSDIASSQCLICHSAGMVLTQPPLKKDEWRAEIMKMRTAYGAPIPDDQVEGLADYLKSINGRQ
jgi:hypothetical protein